MDYCNRCLCKGEMILDLQIIQKELNEVLESLKQEVLKEKKIFLFNGKLFRGRFKNKVQIF